MFRGEDPMAPMSIRSYVIRLFIAFIMLGMVIGVYNVLKAVNISSSINVISYQTNTTVYSNETIESPAAGSYGNSSVYKYMVVCRNGLPFDYNFSISNDIKISYYSSNNSFVIYNYSTGDWIYTTVHNTFIIGKNWISDGTSYNITTGNINLSSITIDLPSTILTLQIFYAKTIEITAWHTVDLGIIMVIIPVMYVVYVMIRVARDMGVTI